MLQITTLYYGSDPDWILRDDDAAAWPQLQLFVPVRQSSMTNRKFQVAGTFHVTCAAHTRADA